MKKVVKFVSTATIAFLTAIIALLAFNSLTTELVVANPAKWVSVFGEVMTIGIPTMVLVAMAALGYNKDIWWFSCGIGVLLAIIGVFTGLMTTWLQWSIIPLIITASIGLRWSYQKSNSGPVSL